MKTRVSFARLLACVLLASTFVLTSSAFGQTNDDLLQTERVQNLTPVAKLLRTSLWSFSTVVLVIAGVVVVLRTRVNPSIYKEAADAQWQDDAVEEAAQLVDETEVDEACAEVGKPAHVEEKTPPAAPVAVKEEKHERLYTPANGPAWSEPMLNAFLSSCLKANCLGRAWQDEAVRRQPRQKASFRVPDPREAEFVRKLKARWHEFDVDPDTGIFGEHAVGGVGKTHVCLLQVSRERHAVARAALNAGFVIESLGRYLKSNDLVYLSGPGCYHAPDRKAQAAMSDEDKKRLLPLKNIPDPWHAMIAG